MASRYAALAVLSLSLASPATAEFCLLEGKSRGEPQIQELRGPRCSGGNRLIFTRRVNSGGYSEEAETFVTDSWPGFMGADKKCKTAEAGAKVVVDRPGSIILGVTLGSKIGFPGAGLKVYAFRGSCYSFRSKFAAKLRELKAADAKAEYEDALEAINAGKSSLSELVDSLIEAGEKPRGKD